MNIYLDRVELHGFKSFPDKTTLKLHQGITTIIGPNGCGKSNIVDAVLWVLGEQKIKNLRGENIEDLIFSGSSTKKPLGMTEVGVYFQNNGTETYLARRYFRNEESKFILNDKFCRNKDIQNALFNMGIGERKYFIFEQGSIDKLISLKPAEKRLLIEEAANISQYLVRKKETVNKLISSEQNLNNIEILITDKNNRLKELKNQVNYVKRYRNLKNEKINYLKSMLKREYDLLLKDLGDYQSEMEKLMSKETLKKKDISDKEKKTLNLEESKWNLEKELKENQKNRYEINKTILSDQSEIEKSIQQKEFLNQKKDEIKKNINLEKDEIKELKNQIKTNEIEISQIKSALGEKKSEDKDLRSDLSGKKVQRELISKKVLELKDILFAKQAEVSGQNNLILDLEKKINSTDNEILGKENFITELKNQINSLNLDKLMLEKTELEICLKNKNKEFKDIEKQFLEINQKIDGLRSGHIDIENEIKSLKNQKEKYIQVKEKLSPNKSDDTSINNLGHIQDQIKSPKKYFKILENFYFEEIDALILKNNLDAENISIDKVLLTRQNKTRCKEEIKNEKGFIACIKDLYSLENENIKNSLKDGILVDNINNGLRIFLKYGIDTITSDAKIINSNSLLIQSRDKGILDVIDEVRDIDAGIAQFSSQLTDTDNKIKDLFPKRNYALEQLNIIKTDLENREKHFMQLKTEIDTIQKNREANFKRIEINKAEIELLITRKIRLNTELKQNLNLKDILIKKTEELIKEKDSGNQKCEKINEEINRLDKVFLQKENTINLLAEKLNFTNNSIQRLITTETKLINNIEQNEEEIIRTDELLIKLKEQVIKLKESREKFHRKMQETDKTIAALEEKLTNLNREIKNQTSSVGDLRKILEEIKEQKSLTEISLSSVKKDLFQLEEISFKELNTELKDIEASQELQHMEIEKIKENVEVFNSRLFTMNDSNKLNFSAESEYNLLEKDYNFLMLQKDDILKSIKNMNEAIEKIDNESIISFNKALKEIKQNFIKNFKILFEGGDAELSLVDAHENILESGLEIKAQPPGKKLQNLRLLSGGEKTLTSLAFLFSLFEYKPSPICIFDEVDASLDEANIQRFLKFLHKLKEKTQFLIITHNFKTMEEADFIYGISMKEPGISTIYSMKMTGNKLVSKK